MAKQKIKYYEVESLSDLSKKENASIVVESSNVIVENSLSTQTIDPLRIEFLHGNPFLYYKDSNYKVETIEEYYLHQKKYNITIAALIGDANFRRSKKVKLVKKTFKSWDKDYQKNKREILKDVSQTATSMKEIEFSKVKKLTKIIIYILFLITSLLIFIPGFLWDKLATSNFMYKIYTDMQVHYQQYSWISIITSCIIYIYVATIIYIHIHNVIWLEFNKQVIYSEKMMETSKNKIDQSYKKKYQSVYKYYISRLKRKNKLIVPYPISKVMLDDINLNIYEKISKAIKEKGAKLKKKKFLYDLLRSSLTVLCYIGSIAVFGFIGYLVVMNFFSR